MDYQEDQMVMARAVQQFLPNCNIRVCAPFLGYETSIMKNRRLGTLNLLGEFLLSAWEATAENGEPVASGVTYLWESGATVVTSIDNAI